MSDRLLCRKWGGDKKEINSKNDGERKHQHLVRTLLLNILQIQAQHPGCPDSQDWKNKAASEQCFRFGFSPTHLFLWATNLHRTANICLTLFPMFSLVLLIKSPSSSSLPSPPSRQPHEPPQGHQSPPASGLHGGNYLCSLRADNPSIQSLLSSPPRSSSLLFPSFIVSCLEYLNVVLQQRRSE